MDKETERRWEIGDRGERRWVREAAGQCYLIAFDIQSILELASEAILHKWPSSGPPPFTMWPISEFQKPNYKITIQNPR
jgi:hypothetical protein